MPIFRPPTLAQIRQNELETARRALHHHQCQLEFEQSTVLMLIARIDRLQDEVAQDQAHDLPPAKAQPQPQPQLQPAPRGDLRHPSLAPGLGA